MRGTAFLLLLLSAVSSAVTAGTHTLHIAFSIQTGISSLPEGMSSMLFDKEYIAHYNSDKMLIPIQNWVKEALGDVLWNNFTSFLSSQIEHLLHGVREAEQLVWDKGVHTLQRRLSCQLNISGVPEVSDEYGYDGETFISLDQEHKYVADMPDAETIVRRWSRHGKEKHIARHCIDWLKRIQNHGKNRTRRPVSPPEVSFLQKTPSSPVVCFATGFYPRAVNMSWQRNGEDVSQNVRVGETLPNDDGTFQKRVSLNVTPEEWNENQYSCVVQHNETIKNLTEEIKTNYGPQPRNQAIVCIPVVLVASVLFILRIALSKTLQDECECLVRCPVDRKLMLV
uniref:Ig-like domain-containing protein n=2 Tax=Pygocentrus nattereri TaxID=42514 RepID=A0A3B4EI18_PYGNA